MFSAFMLSYLKVKCNMWNLWRLACNFFLLLFKIYDIIKKNYTSNLVWKVMKFWWVNGWWFWFLSYFKTCPTCKVSPHMICNSQPIISFNIFLHYPCTHNPHLLFHTIIQPFIILTAILTNLNMPFKFSPTTYSLKSSLICNVCVSIIALYMCVWHTYY